MTLDESKQSILLQNKTVQNQYLYVWANNEIELVFISQFLEYLERNYKEFSYSWKYDNATKTIWKYGNATNLPFPRDPNVLYYDPMNPTTLYASETPPVVEDPTPKTPVPPPVNSTVLGVDFTKPSNIIAVVAVVLLIVVILSRSSS